MTIRELPDSFAAELDRSGRRTLWAAIAAAVLLIVVCVAYASSARADTGLAVIAGAGCVAGPVGAACSERYDVPADADLVRVSPTNTSWSPGFSWKPWNALAPGEQFESCGSDVPKGSPISAGLCTSWPWLPKPAPPRVNPVTVSWDAVPGVAGYEILHGATINGMLTIVDAGTALSKQIDFPDGTRSVTVRTYTAQGLRSDNGPVVSFAMTTPKRPEPPAVVRAELAAYALSGTADKRVWSQIGTVPVGTQYLPYDASDSAHVIRCGVPRSAVKLAAGQTRPTWVYASCGN